MTDSASQLLSTIRSSLNAADPTRPRVAFSGGEALPSVYAVTDLAAASIGAACLAVAELAHGAQVAVDSRLASLWFTWSIRPEGWEPPPVWDPLAGDYQAEDGWRLDSWARANRHSGFPGLKLCGS